jgi:hypothetical protein
MASKKRVLITGIFFPITACLEYIVRAFKRLPDWEVVTAGSAYGRNIVWETVKFLPESYIFDPDIKFPPVGIGVDIPMGMLVPRLGGQQFDLILQVDAGLHFTGKLDGAINATILTDPHVLRDFYDRVNHQYDFVFCTQSNYPTNRDVNEMYIPYGYDPEWHQFQPREKNYDVVLIGNNYSNRVDLINNLNALGVRTCFKLGVGKQEIGDLMNESIIGLNWSSMDDLTARVWETMGCGLIPVVNRVTDLRWFFVENEDYLGFSDKAEAIHKITEVLKNPGNYQSLIESYTPKIKHSTWDDRLRVMLEIMKLI